MQKGCLRRPRDAVPVGDQYVPSWNEMINVLTSPKMSSVHSQTQYWSSQCMSVSKGIDRVLLDIVIGLCKKLFRGFFIPKVAKWRSGKLWKVSKTFKRSGVRYTGITRERKKQSVKKSQTKKEILSPFFLSASFFLQLFLLLFCAPVRQRPSQRVFSLYSCDKCLFVSYQIHFTNVGQQKKLLSPRRHWALCVNELPWCILLQSCDRQIHLANQ